MNDKKYLFLFPLKILKKNNMMVYEKYISPWIFDNLTVLLSNTN